jgi:hypothetical protein
MEVKLNRALYREASGDLPPGKEVSVYVGVLISLWFFLFPVCITTKRIFLGWVKEVRTTKS